MMKARQIFVMKGMRNLLWCVALTEVWFENECIVVDGY